MRSSGQRVRVLHTESSPRFGGQELRIIMEMEKLVNFGIDSFLMAPDQSEILKIAKKKDLTAHAVNFSRNIHLADVRRLTRFIKEFGISVINSHGSKDAWNAGPAAILTGRPFIRSRHVGNPVRGGFFGKLMYGYLPSITVTTSESIADGIVEIGVPREMIKVVPTGVDLEHFRPCEYRTDFRASIGIERDSPLIGYIGVMRSDKGVAVLLRAFKILKDKIPDACLILVGKGGQDAEIKLLIGELALGESAFHLGYMEDIRPPLYSLDVFVHPAVRPEGVPQTLLQAMATKIPVVSTDVGGVSEVAIDGETALVVPSNDPESLSSAIGKMILNGDISEKISSQARKMVQTTFSQKVMFSQMAEIYRKCAGLV